MVRCAVLVPHGMACWSEMSSFVRLAGRRLAGCTCSTQIDGPPGGCQLAAEYVLSVLVVSRRPPCRSLEELEPFWPGCSQ